MKKTVVAAISWVISLWASYIFLGSLAYKFTGSPDTVHIFSTIGSWVGSVFGSALGNLFTNYGAYGVGTFELATSIVLLSPIAFWFISKVSSNFYRDIRAKCHYFGGIMAAGVMTGAVFFHTFPPIGLGIEVLHNGQPDGGSLFKAAVSILIGGIVLLFLNRPSAR